MDGMGTGPTATGFLIALAFLIAGMFIDAIHRCRGVAGLIVAGLMAGYPVPRG